MGGVTSHRRSYFIMTNPLRKANEISRTGSLPSVGSAIASTFAGICLSPYSTASGPGGQPSSAVIAATEAMLPEEVVTEIIIKYHEALRHCHCELRPLSADDMAWVFMNEARSMQFTARHDYMDILGKAKRKLEQENPEVYEKTKMVPEAKEKIFFSQFSHKKSKLLEIENAEEVKNVMTIIKNIYDIVIVA